MQTVLQSESSECGLACLAMISSGFGRHEDVTQLRQRFSTSLKGITVAQLMRHATVLDLATRALRLEVDELRLLKLPSVLHWDLNHFVVLIRVAKSWKGKAEFVINDPAIGERKMSLEQISKHFTGVALEFTPTEEFQKKKPTAAISILQISGNISGLKIAIFQACALAVALEVFAIAAPLFNQFVIDEVLASGDLELLKILMLGFALLTFVQIAIGVARSLFLMRWGTEIGYQWAVRLFSHLIRLPATYFEKRNLGDIVSRFGSIGAIQNTMTTLLVESLLDGMMVFFALGMMLLYSPLLSTIVLAGVVLYAISRFAFYSYLKMASSERIILSAKENSHFLETIRAMTPLKLFGREDERRMRWQNLKMATVNRDVATQKISIWFRSLNGAISSVQGIAILYFGAALVVRKDMSLGMLMAFITYATTFSMRVIGLVDLFTNVKLLAIHVDRVADIALEPVEKRSQVQVDLSKFCGSIALKNVKFRYAEGERWILDDVSFVIELGESVAITGPSGSGKTTLCKILLGLLSPTEGSVLIDGVDINVIGLDQYRKLVGTVMQDDVLLAGSLLENIAFFDSCPDIVFAEACAQNAAIHDDILKMPMRYQTVIGEMGSAISGGQRQRVLLARALYKRPKLLVLDEATSHLDLDNEKRVNESLKKLDVTRLVVAHRPETVKAAMRVIAVQHGKITDVKRDSSMIEKV
ncbi:MAG: peptidase domain-containing ABC transporter [Pseudomonadota bacterium]